MPTKFFPGYVLIKMDLTDDTYHLVKNTRKSPAFLGGRVSQARFLRREAERIIKQVA